MRTPSGELYHPSCESVHNALHNHIEHTKIVPIALGKRKGNLRKKEGHNSDEYRLVGAVSYVLRMMKKPRQTALPPAADYSALADLEVRFCSLSG